MEGAIFSKGGIAKWGVSGEMVRGLGTCVPLQTIQMRSHHLQHVNGDPLVPTCPFYFPCAAATWWRPRPTSAPPDTWPTQPSTSPTSSQTCSASR